MNENMTIDMEKGQITYANEVIATIVSVATTEVEGISGIAGVTGSISGILGKGKSSRSVSRGVRVDMNGDDVNVDVSVTVDYGMPIQKVGRNAQENVRKSIESMTGLHVEKVDLHVVGVSFEKENQEMQLSQQAAMDIEPEEEHAAVVEDDKEESAIVEVVETDDEEDDLDDEELDGEDDVVSEDQE